MAPRLEIFLIWAGASVFLQLDPVNGDHAKRTFPFIYRGKIYESCTKTGSIFWRCWCSLSLNFDQDRTWRYC
ncbi:seminal plasma protein pB1-like [Megaptera novaeangliae]